MLLPVRNDKGTFRYHYAHSATSTPSDGRGAAAYFFVIPILVRTGSNSVLSRSS